MRDLCETWYHMLVSKMLYQRPTVKSVDLHYYVQVCTVDLPITVEVMVTRSAIVVTED